MVFFNVVSYILVLAGAINWGAYGIWDFNIVEWLFGGARSAGAVTVYVLIALAALWLIIAPMVSGGIIRLCGKSVCCKDKSEGKE